MTLHSTIRYAAIALIWSAASIPSNLGQAIELESITIDGGGLTRATSGSVALSVTVGQAVVAPVSLSGGTLSMTLGFWPASGVSDLGCSNDEACDDGVPCTTDVCNTVTGLCDNNANDAFCDDGHACTVDRCDLDAGCRNTYTAPLCKGDANLDGRVDPLDVGFIMSRFGLNPCDDFCGADVNCDGLVDPMDSGYAMARFSTCDPPIECEPVCP